MLERNLMRCFGQIVLMVSVLQLTGMAGVCAPMPLRAGHDCCTPAQEKVPSRTTSPECCFVSAFREHGSLVQTKVTTEHVTKDSPAAEYSPLPVLTSPVRYTAGRWGGAHAVSPPITPLRQTCLLLI
jgi:hypothetical protein